MSANSYLCARSGRIGKPRIAFLAILFVPFVFSFLGLSGCSGLVSATSNTNPPAPSAPSITTSSLPNGQAGIAYSATLVASGGSLPYSWSVSSGSLPPGLTLGASSGQISGIPSAAGTSNLTIQVKDSSSTGQIASKSFSIAIAAGPAPISITTTSLPNGQIGSAYSATLGANGGTAPYTWTVSSGSLPSGLTLASSSGQISGTPGSAGTFSFTIQVTDSSSPAQTASKSLSVAIASSAPGPVSITTSSLANGQMGTAYSATLAATGGKSPYSWSVTTGSLPAGLALAASTGTISGTPSQSGTFSFTVQVTDASSPAQIASKALSINVAASTPGLLQVTTTSLPNGQVGSSYSASLAATGGTTPYTWSVSTGSLPTGVTLTASTGKLTGTPSGTGTFTFLMQVQDSSSPAQTATQSFTVTIAAQGAGTAVTSCGTLSSANTTYVLQNDISSTGTCLTLSASGITVDLNGHKITYDTGASASVYGITASSLGTVKNTHITSSVAGGAVQQSTSCQINLATQSNSADGCSVANPIEVAFAEIDHLTVTYYGVDNSGIYIPSVSSTKALIHDNIVCPYHTKSVLTHYAIQGEIDVEHAQGQILVQNNQIGVGCTGLAHGYGYAGIYLDDPNTLSSTAEILNNQISMAVPVRDGYAITIGCASSSNLPFEIANNTINQASGRGIVIEGWIDPSSAGCGLGTIHDNTVTVKEAANEGYTAGDPIGIQTRFGAHDIQVYNNNVTVLGGQGQCPVQFFSDTGSDCGGIGIKLMSNTTGGLNLTAYNNTVTTTTNNASFLAAGLYGDFTADAASFFSNNTVSSNSITATTDPPGSGMGFDGCGHGWTFKNNTFIELTNPQGFFTYVPSWYCNPSQTGGTDTNNNVFLDNTYQGGAAADNIGVSGGSNSFSYYVKWSYNVTVQNASGQPLSGVTVAAVATGGGIETVSQVTDASGKAQLILTDHFVSGTSTSSPTTVDYNPHTVTVTATGCTVSTSPFPLTLNQTTNQTLVCQ